MTRLVSTIAVLLVVGIWTTGALADVAPDPEDCTESWWEGNGRDDCEECELVVDAVSCEDQYADTDWVTVCTNDENEVEYEVWCTPAEGDDDDDDDDGPVCHMSAPDVAAPLTGGMLALGLVCLFLTRRRD